MQSIKCLPWVFNKNILTNIGFYITLFLFLIFLALFLYRFFKINEIKENLTEHLNGLKDVGVLAAGTNSSKDYQTIIRKRTISNNLFIDC